MDTSAVSARAALDAARAVFGHMSTTGSAASATDVEAATPAGRATAAWRAAEMTLRAVTGRSDLSGQALVGEARRIERLTLGDAHVLVALHGWMERQRDPAFVGAHDAAAPSDGERGVAREAMLALEHAVATVQREAPRDGVADASRDHARDFSGGAARDATGDFSVTGSRKASAYAPPDATSTSAYPHPPLPPAGYVDAPSKRYFGSPAFLIGVVAVVLLAVAGTVWYAIERGGGGAYDEGTAAYSRGSREAARLAFARAATDDPNDARPLIYLGRIARDEGDLVRARRFIERAVRLAPNSAIAQREMGSTLLADGNPDLARRFYVRALEIDPADRLSQGFLACALHRLGRIDDARRFVERAGQGEWTACLSTPVMPMAPGGVIAPGMMPGGVLPPAGTVPPR